MYQQKAFCSGQRIYNLVHNYYSVLNAAHFFTSRISLLNSPEFKSPEFKSPELKNPESLPGRDAGNVQSIKAWFFSNEFRLIETRCQIPGTSLS
jgi:hypothetical protein